MRIAKSTSLSHDTASTNDLSITHQSPAAPPVESSGIKVPSSYEDSVDDTEASGAELAAAAAVGYKSIFDSSVTRDEPISDSHRDERVNARTSEADMADIEPAIEAEEAEPAIEAEAASNVGEAAVTHLAADDDFSSVEGDVPDDIDDSWSPDSEDGSIPPGMVVWVMLYLDCLISIKQRIDR